MNDRRDEYLKYLNDHIRNVKRSWYEQLKPIIESDDTFTEDDIRRIEESIEHHDESKFSVYEWNAYLQHYYPVGEVSEEEQKKQDKEFQEAWLHHQHVNPHHWQYWVLRNDEDGRKVLDMPVEEVINMLCDWNSFTAKEPENSPRRWYDTHSHEMLMSKQTRELIDEFIDYFKPLGPEPDDEDESEE